MVIKKLLILLSTEFLKLQDLIRLQKLYFGSLYDISFAPWFPCVFLSDNMLLNWNIVKSIAIELVVVLSLAYQTVIKLVLSQ